MSEPLNIASLITRVRRVVGAGEVALHEPEFIGRERDYVLDSIDSGWVSSGGRYVDRFGTILGEILGVQPAVPIVNGTAALHLCLELVGVRHGDEVIVPALSFIATANAVSYCGAVPHFVDSELSTLGMDGAKLDCYLADIAIKKEDVLVNRLTGRRIAAVLPVHIFGHPVNLDSIIDAAERWQLPVVEDAAESLGSTYKGRPTGTFGRVSAFSFNGNKIVTTGGGGAIVTKDPVIASRARHLSTTARVTHRWLFDHDAVGYNYRMPNLNAALGCAQLEMLARFVAEKRALAAAYRTELSGLNGVSFVNEPPESTSIYWLNAIMLRDGTPRDEVLDAFNEAGLGARPCWRLLSDLTPYAGCPRGDLEVAKTIERTLVNIPSSARLGRRHLRA